MQAVLLLEHPDYKTAYHTIRNNMAKKGQRSTKDPHGSACEDTVDQTQYAMLCEHLISQPDAAAARNRSIYTHLVASAGRADEGRLTYLPDLMSPRICKCIGNFSCRLRCLLKQSPPPTIPTCRGRAQDHRLNLCNVTAFKLDGCAISA